MIEEGLKMRSRLVVFILWLVGSGVIMLGQTPTSSGSQLSDILARMDSRDLHTHLTAFTELMAYLSSEEPKGSETKGASNTLKNFLTRYPDKADQVKLSLIHLLAEENHSFIETKNPPPDSHAEDDVGEYYAELVDAVSSLNDERAIPALAGAMVTGAMAQRSILKYGDKAFAPVLEQLKSSDALVRSSALDTSFALLEQRGGLAAQAQIKELILAYIKDPGSVVRRSAVQEIGCLNDRQEFVPLLKEIEKTDPPKLPGKAFDGGDGDQFYPVRADARQVLRDIQNTTGCRH
jgi:hypothetical protein